MFFRTMQDEINTGFFTQLTRIEQDRFLQYLYDKGYSVPDMARKFAMSKQMIYTRINAHRGRGPLFS